MNIVLLNGGSGKNSGHFQIMCILNSSSRGLKLKIVTMSLSSD